MNYTQKNFHKWTPKIESYSNGRIAIQYYSYEGEYGPEQECVATINLPDQPLEKNEVIIKIYSENEGLYEMMLQAGHIGPELRRINSGFISAPVCKLLINQNQ